MPMRRGRPRRGAGGSVGSGSPAPASARGIETQPVFARTVDGAFARDLEIGEAFGVDERGRPWLFGALPSGADERVIVDVGGALQDAVLFDEQIYALLQEDGARKEGAFGDDEDAAAGLRALVDGGLNGFGVDGGTVGHGAEVGDEVTAGRFGRLGRGEQRQERDGGDGKVAHFIWP